MPTNYYRPPQISSPSGITAIIQGCGNIQGHCDWSPSSFLVMTVPWSWGRLSPKFWLVPTKFVDTPLPLIFVYECDVQGVELVKK